MLHSLDSFKSRSILSVGGKDYIYYSLRQAEKNGLSSVSELPFSLKILLENLLRFEDGRSVTREDISAIAEWFHNRGQTKREISYRPARILMQDFTGVPALVDLAAMRDATIALGGNPKKINPQIPVDLVIDHSVMVDHFGDQNAFAKNVTREYERNGERYKFLKWGQNAFDNFRVVPPGTGICHQVNLEYLAQSVWTKEIDGKMIAYPDTLVGTDSHTTMVNALSVLGWGVGGIEAEAAMLGQPITMLIPEVIGLRMEGKLPEGTTATDLVLTIVEQLRRKGVVGKFVEFYGPGLSSLSLEDQATVANMAPEYGATCGFFPTDKDTIAYLRSSGRDEKRILLVEEYAKVQGMWRDEQTPDPLFTDSLSFNLDQIVPSLAGPKRPQDRIILSNAKAAFAKVMDKNFKGKDLQARIPVKGSNHDIGNGDVVIAAITSCTNTSNPSVLIGAGLLARNARSKGLSVKPWVKTSLAPGSQIVTDYLRKAGLQDDLDALGFNLVGYGCTTCIGNSGPLRKEISQVIADQELITCSVLSGNRNFEGRISPDVWANYLASPPLVIAYAIAGSIDINLAKDSLGKDKQGKEVYLKDIWPSSQEISTIIRETINREMFLKRYANVFTGDDSWQKIVVDDAQTYSWDARSTYVQNPPYFDGMTMEAKPVEDIVNARILGLFLDSITTDHISPAGSFGLESPAGNYLQSYQISPGEFNSYGSRRGNHQVMMRGTFSNIRIKNQMLDGIEGGITKYWPSGETMPIYDVAMRYRDESVPLIVFAGREYGTGSSRDWAAKGTRLLGVRAVIAQSFERIHRSNLVGMGVLPLVFTDGQSWQSLGMTGSEQVSIPKLSALKPRQKLQAHIQFADGSLQSITLLARIDTGDELDYYHAGGILHYVLRNLNR